MYETKHWFVKKNCMIMFILEKWYSSLKFYSQHCFGRIFCTWLAHYTFCFMFYEHLYNSSYPYIGLRSSSIYFLIILDVYMDWETSADTTNYQISFHTCLAMRKYFSIGLVHTWKGAQMNKFHLCLHLLLFTTMHKFCEATHTHTSWGDLGLDKENTMK